jgi:hypothetical protein
MKWALRKEYERVAEKMIFNIESIMRSAEKMI